MCMLLPLPSTVKTIDQWWRIQIGFTLLIVTIQFLALFIVYIYDTPKGSLLKGNEVECKKMLKELYSTEGRVAREFKELKNVLQETVILFQSLGC